MHGSMFLPTKFQDFKADAEIVTVSPTTNILFTLAANGKPHVLARIALAKKILTEDKEDQKIELLAEFYKKPQSAVEDYNVGVQLIHQDIALAKVFLLCAHINGNADAEILLHQKCGGIFMTKKPIVSSTLDSKYTQSRVTVGHTIYKPFPTKNNVPVDPIAFESPYANLKLLLQAAKKNDPTALNCLGVFTMAYGNKYMTESATAAVIFFQKAAEGRDMTGKFNLAWCYENGIGNLKRSLQNTIRAFELYAASVEDGCILACCHLIWCNTDGIRQFPSEIVEKYLTSSIIQRCIEVLNSKKVSSLEIKQAEDHLYRLRCEYYCEDGITNEISKKAPVTGNKPRV